MLTDSEIVKYYTEGFDVKTIASTDGRSVSTIYRILKNYIKIKDYRILDSDILNKVVLLYKEGKSSREVAKELNISPPSVKRIIKREGISRNRLEAFGIKSEDLEKAIEKYKNGMGAKKSCEDYNFSERVLYSELKKKGVKVRSYSEANALSATSKQKRGLKGEVVLVKDCIKFESFYELLFIIQCLKDENITNISRFRGAIEYVDNTNKVRYYNPDFIVEYGEKECVVEVKPVSRIYEEDVKIKAKYAKDFFKCYRIVTEDDLILYSTETLSKFHINTKEDLNKYINRYKNKIKNEL